MIAPPSPFSAIEAGRRKAAAQGCCKRRLILGLILACMCRSDDCSSEMFRP